MHVIQSALAALAVTAGLATASPVRSVPEINTLQARDASNSSSMYSPATVTLPCGVVNVTGLTSHATNVSSFLSIPFAKAPVGDLRFAPPVTYVYEEGSTVDATKQGPACLQIPGGSLAGTAGVAEDCLTLNVFTPATAQPGAKLPVFVWIYGGGFIEGAAGTFDASAIIVESMTIGEPVVFVAMNYRLGIWGWPQGAEAAANNASNLGLLDQLEALQWVQTNIAQFGGDPERVVIGGESAGAISVSLHMLNPNIQASSLFRGAIMESGAPSTYPVNVDDISRQLSFDQVANYSGCADQAMSAGAYGTAAYNSSVWQCLKYANGTELFDAVVKVLELPDNRYGNYVFGPTIDGNIIPDFPSTLLAEGKFAQLPYISGNNLDEGTIFVPPTITPNMADAFVKLVNPVPVNDTIINELLSFYPDAAAGSPFGTGNETFGLSPEFKIVAAAFGDNSFQGPRRAFIEAYENQNFTQVWSYLFTENLNKSSPTGVSHGSEVAFVFGAPIVAPTKYPAGASVLSEQMIAYWVRFVNHLNPNGAAAPTPLAGGVSKELGLISWPAYSEGQGMNLIQLQGGNLTIIKDDYRRDATDFVNSLGPIIGH